MAPPTGAILEAQAINKRYGSARALRDASFVLFPGEVHAIVGENGAGKTTLERILAGEERADSGRVLLAGEEVRFSSPSAAWAAGIAVVHQHFPLVPAMTVAENIFIDAPPERFRRGPLVMVDRKQMSWRAREALRPFGLANAADVQVRRLPVAQQQVVEIARALTRNARILILDEPTSALTTSEGEALFETVRFLRDEGVAIVFISHRIDEVLSHSDRVTVLRDGETITTRKNDELDASELVSLIVGRPLEEEFRRPQLDSSRKVVFGGTAIEGDGAREPWHLSIHEGEILGLAGLLGSGVDELVGLISGAASLRSGRLSLQGADVSRASISAKIKAGLCLVPGDHNAALASHMSIEDNILLPNLAGLRRWGVVDRRAGRSIVTKLISELDIRPPLPSARVSSLSGGNKQKVAIAKWLVSRAVLLVMDDPFRGVDVGAKLEIGRVMTTFVEDQAGGILFSSSDLLELIGLANRILVLESGKMVAEYKEDEFDYGRMMAAAVGLSAESIEDASVQAERML